MKLFTESEGRFQMYVPIEWEYKNLLFKRASSEPHAFGLYDDFIGAFQISCKSVTDHLKTVIKENNLIIQNSSEDELKFKETFFEVKKAYSYMWMAAVNDQFIFATYILQGKNRKSVKAKKEVEKARACLSALKVIKAEFKNKVLAIRRYNLFMEAVATTIDLRNKAMDNGSFIELVVLTANRIDGLLRLSIILANQLENENDEIDITLLYQSEKDKIITEQNIYEIALYRKIINQAIFDELKLLYKERNKVIHRYIITDIKTEQVLKIAYDYFLLQEKLEVLVNAMEYKQYELNVGINAGEHPPGNRKDELFIERINAAIRDKHGRVKWQTENKNEA